MVKLQIPNCITFRDMNYYQVTDRQTDRQTDRRTESDAYEPTVQYAQVGSMKRILSDNQKHAVMKICHLFQHIQTFTPLIKFQISSTCKTPDYDLLEFSYEDREILKRDFYKYM